MEKEEFGNHEELREEKKQLRELKKNAIFASQITVESVPVTPEQVLKNLHGFEVETSIISHERPAVTRMDMPTEEYIVPPMKVVDRKVQAGALFGALDDYLHWKVHQMGEAEKNIRFITVVGTSEKTSHIIDFPYTGNYSLIVYDCKKVIENIE